MRWDDLFADLEARFDAEQEAELVAEVADRIRSETARTGLAERVAGAVGSQIRVVTLGGARSAGWLRRSGPDWLLLDEAGGAEALVQLSAVTLLSGLPRTVGRPGGGGRVGARVGLGTLLRGVARDRLPVLVDLVDGSTAGGTVERVGRDHLELVEGGGAVDRQRSGSSRLATVLATAAIAMVRRR